MSLNLIIFYLVGIMFECEGKFVVKTLVILLFNIGVYDILSIFFF